MRITKTVLQEEVRKLNIAMKTGFELRIGTPNDVLSTIYVLTEGAKEYYSGTASKMFTFLQGMAFCHSYKNGNKKENTEKEVSKLSSVVSFFKKYSELKIVAKKIPTSINYNDNLYHVYNMRCKVDFESRVISVVGHKICYVISTGNGLYPVLSFTANIKYKDDWVMEEFVKAALEEIDEYAVNCMSKSMFFNKAYIINLNDSRSRRATGKPAYPGEVTKEVFIDKIQGM